METAYELAQLAQILAFISVFLAGMSIGMTLQKWLDGFEEPGDDKPT